MAWSKSAITDGEIESLALAAHAACAEDTRYPLWRGSSHMGGQCLVVSSWLAGRLGGHVGKKRGHYVWLSPDDAYYIDLTGDHGSHPWTYSRNTLGFVRSETLTDDRAQKFAKRADRIFDSLDRVLKVSLDYAGDAFPAQEPQAQNDADQTASPFNDPDENYWHDEVDPSQPAGLYQFVWANGQLEVSPNHGHDELSQHAGIDPNSHTGPFAAGHVVVNNGVATWEVRSNVNLHSFIRILKDGTKNYGWRWGGMTDSTGEPINDSFAPKKSADVLHYVFLDDHLYLGHTTPHDLLVRSSSISDHAESGTIKVISSQAWIEGASPELLPHLFEWAEDAGLTLYSGNDNVIKTIPDLETNNISSPDPQHPDNPVEQSPRDERLPSGLYRCPACSRLFAGWHEYQAHRKDESWADPDATEQGPLPDASPDPIYGDGPHYTEMRQEPGITTGAVVLPARSWKEAARVDGFAKYAKAFEYDNDDYLFYVAYRKGDPLGYVAITSEGRIQMMHSSVEDEGIGSALYSKLTRHFPVLTSNAAHKKTEELMKKRGWVQVKGTLWKWAAGQEPKDMIEAPIPFIFDVQEDKIFLGQPGARQSDIPGKFTPGGIVEGTYEPGGKVIIRSLTSIPYSIYHLIQLWYYSQPTLEVKSVSLEDDEGKATKVASANVGAYVQAVAAGDPAAQTASSMLQRAGGRVFVVGGAVRDAVMGKDPKDIDLMVTGLPADRVSELLEALPGRVDYTGKDFGVFRYRFKGHEVEIALPRRERSTGDKHTDFAVEPDHEMSPEEDFGRRDFTANAMGVDMATGALVDPFNGQKDIEDGVLRSVSDKTLQEDPLRVLRAVVAHAKHGLTPDETTRHHMRDNAEALRHLPAERVQAELDKLMSAKNPAKAIRLARETGVLKHVLPEVDNAFEFGSQNNPHHELDLGDHLVSVLDRISQKTEDPDLRMAALLHDIGKPGSAWEDPETGSNHYYKKILDDGTVLGDDHESLGSRLAEQRMRELRYPNPRINRVKELIAGHMWPAFSTDRGARRFLNKHEPHADDLMTLRWADQGGKSAYPSDPSLSLDAQKALIQKVRDAGDPTSQTALAINGRDLIAAGIPQGPLMGQILQRLTQEVVDNPELNNPQALLAMAQQFAKTS